MRCLIVWCLSRASYAIVQGINALGDSYEYLRHEARERLYYAAPPSPAVPAYDQKGA